MYSWRWSAAEGVRDQLFNPWLIEETTKVVPGIHRAQATPSAIASEDLVLCFASAFGTSAYFLKELFKELSIHT